MAVWAEGPDSLCPLLPFYPECESQHPCQSGSCSNKISPHLNAILYCTVLYLLLSTVHKYTHTQTRTHAHKRTNIVHFNMFHAYCYIIQLSTCTHNPLEGVVYDWHCYKWFFCSVFFLCYFVQLRCISVWQKQTCRTLYISWQIFIITTCVIWVGQRRTVTIQSLSLCWVLSPRERALVGWCSLPMLRGGQCGVFSRKNVFCIFEAQT